MKRILSLLTINLLVVNFVISGSPKWFKNAQKSIVRLYVIQQQGDTVQANAFFINDAGIIVAPFKAIRNGRSAWITDNAGKRFEISRLLGFNTTYDVVRLQAETNKKKPVFLPFSENALSKSDEVFVATSATPDTVQQVEKAGDYDYYTLTSKADAELCGLPVVNAIGQVVAILQTPVTIPKAPNYALDIRMIPSLGIKPIDVNSSDLRSCQIPLQMPADEEQAMSFLYLANAMNNPLSMVYNEDFIRNFPKNASGYIQKADRQCTSQQYEAAYQTYKDALGQQTGKDDEIRYARSRALYNAVLQAADKSLPQQWTLEQALSDITAAKAVNPLPLYTLQEANILFAQKNYKEAYQRYVDVSQSNMRSAEVFMYAWQCQQNLGADNETLLALNDSAMACFTKPYNATAAPYLLLRSNTLTDMGRLRDAINDLNDYEHLMRGQLTATFYYNREQLESQSRMLGPAVNDIHKAISLAPEEPVFHAELAALLYRLNEVDSAIKECQRAIQLDDKFPDAYRLLGICQREKGNKAEARKHLQKAIELGDTMAQGVLDKLTAE